MHLIGINGLKRSGKGATAEIIDKLYEGNVVGVGFADKLKILAAKSLGYTNLSDVDAIALMDEFKETGVIYAGADPQGELPEHQITGRQYLQNIGNEARGLFGDSFWIDMVLPNPAHAAGWEDAAVQALELRYPDVNCLCITDLRYPNEAERVKALGGVVWEVVRPGTGSDGHTSEQPLPRDLVNLTIDNDGTLDDLEAEVEAAMESLV